MRCTTDTARRTSAPSGASTWPARTTCSPDRSSAPAACAPRSKPRPPSCAPAAVARSSPSCRKAWRRSRARPVRRSPRSPREPARVPGARHPATLRHPGPPRRGGHHGRRGLVLKLYRDVTQARAAADIMQRLYAAFYAVGASLAEINPLATTRDGALAALDAKIVIDDNELQRHPELAALRDTSAEAPSEVAAREAGLTFIKLEGSVGCCVNGAGLAMATMDLVKHYGDEQTRLVVQGITGRDGSFHTRQMLGYGTKVVAGVTPGKGGQVFDGVAPVFDTVADAVAETRANTSIIYVPAVVAASAIFEAADAGVALIVCITEGIPVLDMTRALPYVHERGARLIGPNWPGLISPPRTKVGIIPGNICRPGRIGVVSRSGTLTYEIVHQLSGAGYGQSTCVGIGGDPLIGTSFIHCLSAFQADPDTDAVVMVGEIGGTDEQLAADFIQQAMSKPVIGFIAGQTAPSGRRMGHAGAIIAGSSGTAAEKMAAFARAGIAVMKRPADVVALLKERL